MMKGEPRKGRWPKEEYQDEREKIKSSEPTEKEAERREPTRPSPP
jgi:hypothetical protein